MEIDTILDSSYQKTTASVSGEGDGWDADDDPESPTSTADSVPHADVIPDPPSLELTGRQFDEQELLGSGGTADVSRAVVRNGSEETVVALKQPRTTGTVDSTEFDRLLEEAARWSKLDTHKNIVSVIDYGADPIPWIAMEYMDGGHLGTVAGELPFRQALWTTLAVAAGVRYAHDHGIAHLDLKPENILFREITSHWNVPKVADWGLSKHLLEHSQNIDRFTPTYAAPEQFDDSIGQTGKQTDIYQLGAVFYELFTGRPPFEGQPVSIMQSVLNETPPAPSTVASVPGQLDEILLTALETRPQDRYEHILYFRDALDNLYSGCE